MQLLSIGLNYQSASLDVRERVAFSGPDLDEALATLKGRVQEGFILSTCNRTEIYALVGHADTGAELLINLLSELTDVPQDELLPHLYVHSHEEVTEHLFLVASGMQSMVPGEDQIMAQIKEALETAAQAGSLGAVVRRLGDAALSAGKRVRTETGISRRSLSVVSVALQLASEHLNGLGNKKVVVMGAGQTAELALKHLFGVAGAISVINRSAEKGAELAARFEGTAATRDRLPDEIADADLVISCTSAPGFVIDYADVAAARKVGEMAGGGAAPAGNIADSRVDGSSGDNDIRPLLLLDLAVPRDIDPACADLPGVSIFDIDHLQAICDRNRELREGEMDRVRRMVEEESERFIGWWRSRQIVPTIQALISQAETVQEVEISRLMNRLSLDSERDRDLIRLMVARVVSKLFHRPITLLKEDPEGGNMAMVIQHLFGLNQCPVTPGGESRVPSPHSPLLRNPITNREDSDSESIKK